MQPLLRARIKQSASASRAPTKHRRASSFFVLALGVLLAACGGGAGGGGTPPPPPPIAVTIGPTSGRTSSSPTSTGQNITVVEPTTAGEASSTVSFDLNVSPSGARTLFLQDANLDRTSASGVLEIQ